MLNPFPELLWLGFFAPTIVRIAAGALFLYAARYHWQRREALSTTDFPVIGRGEWIGWSMIVLHLAVGAMLVFGYYTQYAALLAAIGALKGMVWGPRYKEAFVFPRSTYVLLLAISLSLLVSGAGAFAFDLPL